VELLTPVCEEVHALDFVRWFAMRSGGVTLFNDKATEVELVAALEDYPSESGLSPAAVGIWYALYFDGWVAALQSGGQSIS